MLIGVIAAIFGLLIAIIAITSVCKNRDNVNSLLQVRVNVTVHRTYKSEDPSHDENFDTDTDFYVEFIDEQQDRYRYRVGYNDYLAMTKDQYGLLTYQGNQYIVF